jgi:hypothetical protein
VLDFLFIFGFLCCKFCHLYTSFVFIKDSNNRIDCKQV